MDEHSSHFRSYLTRRLTIAILNCNRDIHLLLIIYRIINSLRPGFILYQNLTTRIRGSIQTWVYSLIQTKVNALGISF
jgi:hypothetical protein